MPPKLQENTVKGFCAKAKNPPKGVGGQIVQSLELKRNVSQSRRGNKVFERAIEERQVSPGKSTLRIGTKVYFFDNDEIAFQAKMENLNKELSAKCNEMDELDASLAENEMKMARLDAELEKLDIKGEEAIEDAIITESEDLDLLLVPSIQNLIFKIYSESGITIPSDSDKCKDSPKKGPSKCELKQICKQFCKDEFERLERDKKKANNKEDSPCVVLSTASEATLEHCREDCFRKFCDCEAPQGKASSPVRKKQVPLVGTDPKKHTASQNRPQSASKLEDCKRECDQKFGRASQNKVKMPAAICAPPPKSRQQSPQPQKKAQGASKLEECMSECDQKFGNASQNKIKMPAAICAPPPQCKQSSPQPQKKAQGASKLEECLEDCDRKYGKAPQNRAKSPASKCPPPRQNKQQGASSLEDCLKDCDEKFGKPPQRAKSPPVKCPPPRQNKRQGASSLEDCLKDCDEKFGKPVKCPPPRQNKRQGASNLEDCLKDCDEKFGKPAQREKSPPVKCPPPRQNKRQGASSLEDCLKDCDEKFGKPVKCPPPRQNKRQGASNLEDCLKDCDEKFGKPPQRAKSPPVKCPPAQQRGSSALENCLKECKEKFSKASVCKAPPRRKRPHCREIKRISARPPLFSRIVNGKRCFPDLSEISKKDQTLYMAERDAYILFRRQLADRGDDCQFFENVGEFEEFFYNYINGTCKINVPICPSGGVKPENKTSDEIVQTFVDLQKIDMDSVLQRNVVDLALDRPDRDPEIIALLMNERLPAWVDPMLMSEIVTPYPLQKRLFATDVRHTAPGSMVPKTLPIQALNLMNTHVIEGVEAIIKSNEYLYPTDDIATQEIREVAVIKPEKGNEPPPDNYKCYIELHPFRVETFFQLRGANVPLWYPGMFTAFPDGRSTIKLVSTPSALINTAWRMCAP